MKTKLSKLWNNKFIQGGTIYTTASFLINVINYFFNVLVARGLGPTGFGEITALFSYTTIFSVPILVMSMVIIQKIGAKGEYAKGFSQSLEIWFLSKLEQRWYLILPILFISPFIPRFTNLSPLSGYILIPLVMLSFVGAFYGALLQGLQAFAWISGLNLLSGLLKFAGALFVIAGIDGIATIIVFLLFSSIITLLLSHVLIRKNTQFTEVRNPDKINKRLRDAIVDKHVVITFFSILSITLLNNIDIIFVKKFFSAQDAGIYSAWSLFAKIITYVIGPITMVSYIFFSNKQNSHNHKRILYISMGILIFTSLSCYIIYRFFPFFAIHLFFGPRYESLLPYLPSASIFGALYATITLINNYFLAKKSSWSLLLMGFIAVYAGALYTFSKSFYSIIQINIIFAAFIALIYMIAYIKSFIYNSSDGKSKN